MNGVGSELGKAAVAAIHKARGMELAGALDRKFQGQDAGEVIGFYYLRYQCCTIGLLIPKFNVNVVCRLQDLKKHWKCLS